MPSSSSSICLNTQFSICSLFNRKSYGSLVFMLNTLVYIIFLIFLTSAVALMVSNATQTRKTNTNATSNQTQVEEETVICSHLKLEIEDYDYNGRCHVVVFIWPCFSSHGCYICHPSTDQGDSTDVPAGKQRTHAPGRPKNKQLSDHGIDS